MKVIIVGGGASGLVAAIIASQKHDVTILEKNAQVGKKILVTGNGKCNYFHADFSVSHFHSQTPSFLEQIITKENIQKTISFLEELGIVPFIKDGYYYPNSKQAVSIQNLLKKEALLRGVKMECDVTVEDIEKDETYQIMTNKGIYHADKVVLATGSFAYYPDRCDTGYQILRKFGHSIVEPLPGLVPLETDFPYQKEWAGIRTTVKATLVIDQKLVKEEVGEMQLTEFGVSGIPVMQLSNLAVPALYEKKSCHLVINFLHGICHTIEEAKIFLENRNDKLKGRTISELLDSVLNYKLVNALLKSLHIANDACFDSLSHQQKEAFAETLVCLSLSIKGSLGFSSAQICTGGLSLAEIDTTFASCKQEGFYVIGELLDVAGDCGGYNLGFAWMSGILVGEAL